VSPLTEREPSATRTDKSIANQTYAGRERAGIGYLITPPASPGPKP